MADYKNHHVYLYIQIINARFQSWHNVAMFLSQIILSLFFVFSFHCAATSDIDNIPDQSSVETLDDEPNGEPVYTSETQASQEQENYVYNEADVPTETPELDSAKQLSESTSFSEYLNTHGERIHNSLHDSCELNYDFSNFQWQPRKYATSIPTVLIQITVEPLQSRSVIMHRYIDVDNYDNDLLIRTTSSRILKNYS